MAIAYEAAQTSINSNSCNTPSGSGNLLVAVCSAKSAVISTPSGWTQIDKGVINTSDGSDCWCGYILTGSPAASYTWDFGGAGSDRKIVIQRFAGVEDYGGAGTPTSDTSGTTNNAGSVTPDTNGSLIAWIGGGDMSSTPGTPTDYSNLSHLLGGSVGVAVCSRVQATAGATGTVGSTGWDSASATKPNRGVQAWFRPADTTAPALTSPTGTATGQATATGTVTTDEANGTLYAVVTTSDTPPSVAQVQAGQDHTGAAAVWSGSQAISTTGAKTANATGLTAATTYYYHYCHVDAVGNESTVVSSSSFTTDSPPAGGCKPRRPSISLGVGL